MRHHCSSKNIHHKCQLVVINAANPVNWPKGSQKYDLCINKEGMSRPFVSRQLPLAKELAECLRIKIIGYKFVCKETAT